MRTPKTGRSGSKVLARPAPTPKVTKRSGPMQQSEPSSAAATAPSEAKSPFFEVSWSRFFTVGISSICLAMLQHLAQCSLEALRRLLALERPGLDLGQNTALHVRLQQLHGDAVHGLLQRRDLDEDVVTALVLLQH